MPLHPGERTHNNNIRDEPSASTVALCCAACQAEPACMFFEHYILNGTRPRCWLKSSGDGPKGPCVAPYSDCTSGGVQPAPPAPRPLPVGPSPLPRRPPAVGARRPHVILFIIDDFGFANVGYHNAEHTNTPNLDREAAAGIKLERHYSFRWCAPARASLMTGRLPYHVLETTNYVTGAMNMLPAKLKQVGYRTHQIGST